MNKFYLMGLLVLVVFVECSTYRAFVPAISEQPRNGLFLKDPALISITDGRANAVNNQELLQSLQNGIKNAYGNSLLFSDYYSKIPEGKVFIRIKVMALGATFGSRIVSSLAIGNMFESARVTATSSWQTVVASASSNQSILASSFTGEGWWIGTSWLLIQIQDKRYGNLAEFSVPIVAEHREFNMWGYGSAQTASQRSWEKVSPQLFEVLDKILITMRDEEK